MRDLHLLLAELGWGAGGGGEGADGGGGGVPKVAGPPPHEGALRDDGIAHKRRVRLASGALRW